VRSLAGDSSCSPPYQSARRTSVKIARACEDYARQGRYQNVTLADLCEASGVSERRVRSAFYECYQMPPTAYLRVTALNAVRRELVEGPHLRGVSAVPRLIGASGTSAASLPNTGRYSASPPGTRTPDME
jgi:AraC-like DNA-binding protein